MTADKNGIRFTDVVWEEPALAPNRKKEDIGPFMVLPKGAWDMRGIDLSIPYDAKKTAKARKELDSFLAELEKKNHPKGKQIRTIAYHNLALARKMQKSGEK